MESMRFKHVFEGVLILRHNVNVTRWIATISSTPSVQASKLSLDHNTAREKNYRHLLARNAPDNQGT